MLNIISRSIQNKKTRGPKKVVDNLILGLERMGYPYVINKDLNSCKRLWIQDDTDALYDLKNINEDVKVLVGPNLFVNPENIPDSIDLSKTVYVQPSKNVLNIWEKKGYDKSPLEVWAVGIDTEKYVPFADTKDIVLVYFKNRTKEELNQIETILKNKEIDYKTIVYGTYQEAEYHNLLKRTKYIIWLGIYESQGIALEEALSCNIPMIVLDTQIPKNTFDIHSTSAPYFDGRCGIIIKDMEEFDLKIQTMEKSYKTFQPRDYILENLELRSQAEKFIDLYEKYFGLRREDGFKEKCDNTKDYKVSVVKRLYRKIYGKLFRN
jgi:glycosyltransferase involved in cell wall biosynthesis